MSLDDDGPRLLHRKMRRALLSLGLKACPGCMKVFPLRRFAPHPNGRFLGGVRPLCRKCEVKLYSQTERGLELRRRKNAQRYHTTKAQKLCPHCNQWCDLRDFGKNASRPDGRRTECNPCRREERRKAKGPTKKCARCPKSWPATPEYWLLSRTHEDGFFPECKACHSGRDVESFSFNARGAYGREKVDGEHYGKYFSGS